jgi:hypothetical protein
LINNIAWGLRYLPVFGIFGDGRYRLQPIHVDDLAEAVVLQAHARTNATIDAIGPETFRYRDMVEMIAEAIGVRPCRRQHFAKCVPSVLPGFAFMRRPSTRRAPTPAGKGLVASRLRTAPANVHRLLSGERAQRPKASQTASLKRLLTARTQLLARSEVFQNPSPVPSANGCYAWYFCEVAKIVPHGAA